MIIQDIKIQRARTGDILVVVSGVSDWTGLLAALYVAKDTDKTVVFALEEGTIDEVSNSITFSYEASDTILLTNNRYLYEVVLYNEARTVVQTVTNGVVIVESILQITP